MFIHSCDVIPYTTHLKRDRKQTGTEEKSLKKSFVILIVLAITLSVVVAFAASSNPAPTDLIINTSNDAELSLNTLLSQNDLVILNIFQPGLATSSLELPWFDDVYEDLDDRVAIVAISPTSTYEASLASLKASHGLSFPVGTAADLTAYLKAKGIPVTDYPSTVVMNNQGTILYTYTESGYFKLPSQLRSVVDYLLRSPFDPVTSYTLVIRDEGNQPVPGVVLNFYGGGSSQMLTSDQDGVVVFTAKPATYHFQMLNVPEGYEVDSGFEGTVKDWMMVTVQTSSFYLA